MQNKKGKLYLGTLTRVFATNFREIFADNVTLSRALKIPNANLNRVYFHLFEEDGDIFFGFNNFVFPVKTNLSVEDKKSLFSDGKTKTVLGKYYLVSSGDYDFLLYNERLVYVAEMHFYFDEYELTFTATVEKRVDDKEELERLNNLVDEYNSLKKKIEKDTLEDRKKLNEIMEHIGALMVFL